MATIDHWARLTSPELSTIAERDPVAILPVAAIEQHGPHLPLDTDVTIGRGLIDAACVSLAENDIDRPIVILPALTIGASLEHTGFVGTLSLSAEQTIAQIRAIGASVARAGIRRLLLFNSHGGNKAVVDIAALQLRSDYGLFVAKANYFRFAPPPNVLAAEELAHGLHGGALETSMMLYLAPNDVRPEHLSDHRSLGAHRAEAGHTLGPEGDAGFAWRAEDLNPAGVTGNAANADGPTGQRLVTHFAKRLARVVLETARFDLDTLGR